MVVKRPHNFNGNAVQIAELVRTGPTIDPVFRVPVNTKIRKVLHTYDAQINLGNKEQDGKSRTTSGNRPDTDGHLVLRTCDLAPHTSVPKPETGWQIVSIFAGTDQEQPVDYLIEEVRHESPYKGRALLLYVEFRMNKDRSRKGPV